MVCFGHQHDGPKISKFVASANEPTYLGDGLILVFKWVPLGRRESCVEIIKERPKLSGIQQLEGEI